MRLNYSNVYEWEFKKPAFEVDLARIVRELDFLSAVTRLSYMGNLKEKAPTVYQRLSQYCRENKTLTWWRFDVDHN